MTGSLIFSSAHVRSLCYNYEQSKAGEEFNIFQFSLRILNQEKQFTCTLVNIDMIFKSLLEENSQLITFMSKFFPFISSAALILFHNTTVLWLI